VIRAQPDALFFPFSPQRLSLTFHLSGSRERIARSFSSFRLHSVVACSFLGKFPPTTNVTYRLAVTTLVVDQEDFSSRAESGA